MTTTEATTSSARLQASPKLGEELPVFCERCGYSLHGLPQMRCEHCTLLQFHCPECGHHQPINTLRPAVQTILGRIRGAWLVLVILFKLNLIGWTLFAWIAMGAEYSDRLLWLHEQLLQNQTKPEMYNNYIDLWQARGFDLESVVAFVLFGLPFGAVLRMALLRWKRGWAVGLVLATLAMLSIMLGVWMRHLDLYSTQPHPSGYSGELMRLMGIAFVAIALGATIVWPIWTLLVRAFLPRRTATALLNWQRSLSNEVSSLARPRNPASAVDGST
jgi:hypothetical protein